MSADYSRITKAFLIFLSNIRELFAKTTPEIWNLIDKQGFSIQKDPFGKYYNCIVFVGNQTCCTMTEFADFFNLSPGTATGIIDKLVFRNLLTRKDNPADRRKVEIVLAELGQLIYDKAQEFEREQVRSLLTLLTEDEIQIATSIMQKLNQSSLFSDFS